MIAVELAEMVLEKYHNTCNCDPAKGEYCEVDLAMQLLVELESNEERHDNKTS